MSNSWSRRRKPKRAASPVEVDIVIRRLGASGDGIAEYSGKPVYVSGLLPGEEATVRLTGPRGDGRIAETLARHSDSADRVTPECKYADECGGCSVQHLTPRAYLAWKEGLLARALASKGLTPERLEPMVEIKDGRRRLRFAAIGRSAGPVLGFNMKASKQIVGIDYCIAAEPALSETISNSHALLSKILSAGETADLEVRTSLNGLDFLLVRARPLEYQERVDIAAWMSAIDAARFAWLPKDNEVPEVIIERRAPALSVAGISVTPSPGAFLQPTAAGEEFMAEFVLKHLRGARRVADLYSGWGAFALRLAKSMHVEAFEGSETMISSLNLAAGAAGLGGHLMGFTRDLERQPLQSDELGRFDGIVLDPPRAGALKQVQSLVTGGPKRIAYLSCNPAALARDGKILVDGGYRFVEAQPIDQFRWTSHLEVACLFERDR
jgi:23S rRNA (uracil1939-C5)-methyltransferase